jgi:glutamine amidotransferase PdxT
MSNHYDTVKKLGVLNRILFRSHDLKTQTLCSLIEWSVKTNKYSRQEGSFEKRTFTTDLWVSIVVKWVFVKL